MFEALGLVGLGTSLFSSAMGMGASSSAHDAESRAYQVQMQEQALRRQSMEVSAQRQQMQNLRNTQLQRSMSLNSAVNQGAQFGSGLPGGQAQVSDQGGVNALGISQNLQMGEKMFDLDNQVSADKLEASNYNSQAATWQGIGSMASSITKAAPTLNNIFSGAFGGGQKGMVDLYDPNFKFSGNYYG